MTLKEKLAKRQSTVEVAQKKVPLKEAVKMLAAKGITLKKVDGEYQVNKRGNKEATCYYTDSLEDAIGTALHQWGDK